MPETYFIPAKTIQLPDGSTLVKPGKAITRCKASQAAKLTGVSRKVLARLAECGLIRRACPSPAGAMYYPAEVESFIARTENDPDFWDDVRTQAYLSGKTIRGAVPK
jgi:hypothetical protein